MIRLNIPGMTCGGCVRSITNAVQDIDADARVEANIAEKSMSVETHADRDTLAKAIREAGYEVRYA